MHQRCLSLSRRFNGFQKKNYGTSMQEHAKLNAFYEPKGLPMPAFNPKPNQSQLSYNVDLHNKSEWDLSTITESAKEHTLFTWLQTDFMRDNAIMADKHNGCYFFDKNGKKYIDFSSQAVCANLGHSVPDEIQKSLYDQMNNNVSYVYGGLCSTEIRARLSLLLSEICPGNINAFLFPSSGAEANECAIRIARKYTNKKKILSRYRSYHGGTLATLSLTGDHRRFFVDQDAIGFIKIFDPYPEFFKWGDNNQEVVELSLKALHEQIINENPDNIAAILMESITGTNGWIKPPVQYMQGIRALCDKYNILFICDEVMAGFGRTGKMFGFEHFDGVLPDIMTFAKGITGSFLPLSGVGVSDDIMTYFRNNPLGYGSTFQAHPLSLACAYAVVKYMLDNNVVQHSFKMESVIKECMNDLLNDNSVSNAIKHARIHGMAGGLDIMDPDTNDMICGINQTHPKIFELKKTLLKNGVCTLIRGNFVHVCPPLIAQESDIKYGFEIIHKSLKEVFC